MQTDLIIVSEYCRICHIEPSFLYLLQKGGLIEIDTVAVSYTHLTLPTNSRV